MQKIKPSEMRVKYYYKDGTIYEGRLEDRPDDKIVHREDGPALEWIDGKEYWYINGARVDPETLECLSQLPSNALAILLVSPNEKFRILARYYLRLKKEKTC